jgi:hypothetical protein
MDRVTIRAAVPPIEAIAAWRALFPEPGVYQVERVSEYLAKATPGGPVESPEFEEWFLRELLAKVKHRFVSAQYAIWEVLDDLLRRRNVQVPSELDLWELNRTLFEVTRASSANMVGFRIPADLRSRLTAIGFSLPEVADFPALAYRMGVIYDRLKKSRPLAWTELTKLAEAKPLSTIERAAIQRLRTRAGVWLTPIFDETGRVWTAERELTPLRRIAVRAAADRVGARKAARELANSQRARGIVRDAERVMRTELAEAQSQGSWDTRGKEWRNDAKIFRQVSASPCEVCLRLYVGEDGKPRIYTKADVERWSKDGPNRGPKAEWTPRIGNTHPNERCPPWTAYHPAMEKIFDLNAKRNIDLMRQMKILPEAA